MSLMPLVVQNTRFDWVDLHRVHMILIPLEVFVHLTFVVEKLICVAEQRDAILFWLLVGEHEEVFFGRGNFFRMWIKRPMLQTLPTIQLLIILQYSRLLIQKSTRAQRSRECVFSHPWRFSWCKNAVSFLLLNFAFFVHLLVELFTGHQLPCIVRTCHQFVCLDYLLLDSPEILPRAILQ